MRIDPREAVLAKLTILRGQRMDCERDTVRYSELTALINDLLERLTEMSRCEP